MKPAVLQIPAHQDIIHIKRHVHLYKTKRLENTVDKYKT